jgi:Ribonucleotide reductase inhibitor
MPRSSPDTHQAKRQYQPPITHFLAPAAQQSDRSHHHRAQQPRNERAALDASTQASLLNVGMRIRKAVPEGYKTHKTAASTAEPRRPAAVSAVPPFAPGGSGSLPSSGPRELTPFCGLHKVGGLRQQEEPWPPSAWPNGSQDSNSSSGSGGGDGGAMSARLKRDFSQSFCDGEDVDDLEIPLDDVDGYGGADVDVDRRAIAMARGAGSGAVTRGAGRWAREEQRSSGDFGEAPFLAAGDDVDVDMY